MKKIYLVLIVLPVVIIVIVAGVVFLVNNIKTSDKKVLAISDASKEAVFLGKYIQNSNKQITCIDEVYKAYQQAGINIYTPEIVARMRKCSSVVIKNVSKTGLNVYLVKYNKMMPAGCPNAGALTDLLDIKVNMGNKQTTATWQNGLFFSDIAMKNIDNIIQHEDCTAYAGAMISRLKLNQPVKK